MKPFNLQKAIDGEPLETVTGHEVFEFHYFDSAAKANSTNVAAATVKTSDGIVIALYDCTGNAHNPRFNLQMKTKKLAAYIDVFVDNRFEEHVFGEVYVRPFIEFNCPKEPNETIANCIYKETVCVYTWEE